MILTGKLEGLWDVTDRETEVNVNGLSQMRGSEVSLSVVKCGEV